MEITNEALKELGFEISEWDCDDGTVFSEMIFKKGDLRIEVYGESPEVTLVTVDGNIDVPNCKTIDDIKTLLKLFFV